MKLAKRMQLRRLCRLTQVSRAGFYRWRKRPTKPADRDLEVRDAIQHIALKFPCYGSRRIRFELERRGYAVNRKRVQRLMREDNLLCLRRRKFVVTTDSNHNLPVYPNLAATLRVTRVDQFWVADITYIRLEVEYIYLAVILDAFSRRELGWALDRAASHPTSDRKIARCRVIFHPPTPYTTKRREQVCEPTPGAHRLRCVAVGYSLAGWSPSEPASASPTGR